MNNHADKFAFINKLMHFGDDVCNKASKCQRVRTESPCILLMSPYEDGAASCSQCGRIGDFYVRMDLLADPAKLTEVLEGLFKTLQRRLVRPAPEERTVETFASDERYWGTNKPDLMEKVLRTAMVDEQVLNKATAVIWLPNQEDEQEPHEVWVTYESNPLETGCKYSRIL